MQTFLTVVHIFLAFSIIVLVLMQHGKGASLGASFGAGAASDMFGPVGTGNILSRSTAVLVAAFFVVSMSIAVYGKYRTTQATQFLDEDLPVLLEPTNEDSSESSDVYDAGIPPLE